MDPSAEATVRTVDWDAVVRSLEGPGWVRLPAIVDRPTCARLLEAAPDTWSHLVEDEAGTGVVRQGGLSCHAELAHAASVVRSFAQTIESAVNGALSTHLPEPKHVPELPRFNHAQWGRPADGVQFITPHRDPPGAGGIIAVTTLTGRARFRVWDDDGTSNLPSALYERSGAHQWYTGDGDLVLLRGSGWPSRGSRCPVHEVESPANGDRVILTLRRNMGGYGADYFTPLGNR